MKILKYVKYRMQGYTKEETYYNMAINGYCTFKEYKNFYDKKVKEGETNVSNKRNSLHTRKANRT